MTQMVAVKDRVANVRTLLERSKSQIAMALPRHMNSDRMLRLAMTSVQRTPKLLECDPLSLIGAVIQAAQLGLEPDGVLGQAYLIPFRNNRKGTTEVQFLVGYKGLLVLARRSGEISTVSAHAVRQGDAFRYRYGLEPMLEHIPAEGTARGEITMFYAVVKLKDGGSQFEVMSRADVEGHRDRYAKAAGDGPWTTNFEEMGLKTVLRKTLKLSPSSVELQRAVVLDEHAEAGLPQDLGTLATETVTDIAPPAPSKLDKLTEDLKKPSAAQMTPAVETPVADASSPEGHPARQDSGSVPAAPLEDHPALVLPDYAEIRAAVLSSIEIARKHIDPTPDGFAKVIAYFCMTDDLAKADVSALDDLLVFLRALVAKEPEAKKMLEEKILNRSRVA